jgi:hypothetical protein
MGCGGTTIDQTKTRVDVKSKVRRSTWYAKLPEERMVLLQLIKLQGGRFVGISEGFGFST